MRYVLHTLLIFSAAPVFAHSGHIGELAGHDHVIAGVALGAAVGIAIWGALRGKRKDVEEAEVEVETDAEPQEA